MKTTAYLQIVPTFDNNGKLKTTRAARVSTRLPSEPLMGVMLKLEIDLPDAVFEPLKVAISVPVEAVKVTPQVNVASMTE